MSASPAPPSTTLTKLSSPASADIIEILVKRNPTTDRAQIKAVGNLVAEVSAEAVKLSPADLKSVVAGIRKLLARATSKLDASTTTLKLTPRQAAEVSQGKGIGSIVSAAEGQARLASYVTPTEIEDWAGPLARPTELQRRGVARSTLNTWKKQGAVIGILVGLRKHVFPVEQFIDGRPVKGLAGVLEAIGDPRTAWLWLREPNPGLAGITPLARLKSGAVDEVIEVAWSNFGDR